MSRRRQVRHALTIAAVLAFAGSPAAAGEAPFDQVTKDLSKVISVADGSSPFYELYTDKEKGKLLAAFPRGYDQQTVMIACTVSGGDPQAGVMGPTHYAKWHKIGDQLALVAPNLSVRTNQDKQAQDSVGDLYTGRVLLSLPILSHTPDKRPVVDLGSLATRHAPALFGSSVFAGYGPSLYNINPSLARITSAKAFPENVIFEYTAPRPDGQIVSITYNISNLKGSSDFKPRKADARVGYFYDWHQDFGVTGNNEVTDRYISRWNIQKADPSLKLSPPKEPLVWYIEHTTPVRFRRYVREGIEMWNDAFREIGIDGALEVRQQDANTGAFMDIDPEDARFNFFRWNASSYGYAIGPSRTNPYTGEILDADVVWHQGLTRAITSMLGTFVDEMTEQSFDPETLAFFAEHPNWDPRVRLAPPEQRELVQRNLALEAQKVSEHELGDREHPWSCMSSNHMNAACTIGNMLSVDLSIADAALAAGMMGDENTELLDGIPENYMGEMIRYISAHEVGHCLGLQHNMAASTYRSLEEMNSEDIEGATTASVMDYIAANINHELGEVQGPFATPEVGPYDRWAIAFGYGPESEIEEVLKQSQEPGHLFIPQSEITFGSDPRNVTWDNGADNMNFARSRLSLVQKLRGELLTEIVDDGESWSEARRRFNAFLGTHLQSVSIAATYVGGSYITNARKGDPDAPAPITDISADRQREAMNFVIDNTFEDAAFGITPELIRHLGKEYWWDPQGINELLADPSATVHDLVGGLQATGMTFLMNPTRLRRVYDNEFRADPNDKFTLAELVTTVTNRAWSECSPTNGSSRDDIEISSFRRNLQREHTDRLIQLMLLDGTSSPSLRTIATLASAELGRIDSMCDRALERNPDSYTTAHLSDIRTRISKAMDAAYVIER
ncbi:unnamed protein product [Symbiodinium sp. CCMP2592]|nr:unnamed protein product [Symbiodinium sp. CCMP2592]